jgi:uncharacterized protein YbjT (DUF2867 family)
VSSALAVPSEEARPRVVVGGASGFVGRALAAAISDRYAVSGTSRRPPAARGPFDEWRTCDLLNLRESEAALKGATYAFYLVHSMMPSARLTQGSFADLDLFCADNFARAAAKAGVKQIVYLGGLIPEGVRLSPHLESRVEVERTLAAHGVPLTTLRAGLIVGGGGSSFDMLVKLVTRLPAMVCPAWTRNRMQPIALDDVVQLLAFVLGREPCFGQTYDVGAPEVLSYRALLGMTAELLGLRRRFLSVPWFSPRLSRLWVTLVTGAPRALVGPLVESLRHEMLARDDRLARDAGVSPRPIREAMGEALAASSQSLALAPRPGAPKVRADSLVQSIQRMHLPSGRDARWAATEYARWLPHALRGLIRVDVDSVGDVRFFFLFVPIPLLVLNHARDRSTPDRQLFFIGDGLLSRRTEHGRFEMRQVLDGRTLIVAIHDYCPRLPWYLYVATQSLFHLAVMAAFRRHLERADAAA